MYAFFGRPRGYPIKRGEPEGGRIAGVAGTGYSAFIFLNMRRKFY
jgi:hypothetical protein